MTDVNPKNNSQSLLAAQAQPSNNIPAGLRQSSSEDLVSQSLESQGILASQPRTDLKEGSQDFNASTSLGASINESMMMPAETLADGVPDLFQLARISAGDDEVLAPESRWQKSAKMMDQRIRQNPFAYIAGALSLGLIVGRRLGSNRHPTM